MGEEEKDASLSGDDTGKDQDGTENGTKTGQDGDGDGQGNKDQGDKGKDGKGQPQPGGEDDKPPVRKTASDFYKERQERKMARSQAKETQDDGKKDKEDEEVAPEDEDLISKVIEKRYGGVLKDLQSKNEAAEDAKEATDFFAENPEFKPYEAKILKWWGDESRRHLPISTVALEAVGFKTLIKLGAEKERQAADKAKQTTTTGDGAGDNGGKKSIADMSDDEIRQLNSQVISRRGE